MKQKAYRQNPTVIDLSKKARPPPGETTLIYKLLKDGCYVSLFSRNEPSIEDSDIPISIYLKQYSFCDDIDLYRALKKEDHSEFPHKLEGRRRYQGGRHCCIFHESSVVIAQTTEPFDFDEE